MSKKNNKGFTLVELIIAMSILSIVLGIGYSIMTKSSVASKNQAQVFNEQQTATIANKYITKDLEQCKTIEKKEDSEDLTKYSYIINEHSIDKIPIEYIVVRDVDNGTYNVTRKEGSSSIEIVSNQSTNSTRPFTINYKYELENILIVKMNGKNRQGEFIKYEFEVTSRVTDNIVALGWDEPDDGIEGDDNINNDNTNDDNVNNDNTNNDNTNDDNVNNDNTNNDNTNDDNVNNDNTNNDTNQNPHIVTGVVLLTYSMQGNSYTTKVEAEPLLNSNRHDGILHSVNSTVNGNSKSIDLKVKIPFKNSDQFKVYMKSDYTRKHGNKYYNENIILGDENAVFGGISKWSLFKQSLITEGIQITTGDFFLDSELDITINGNIKLTRKDGKYEFYPKLYYSSESQIPNSFDVYIKWTSNGNRVLANKQSTNIKIVFGNFNTK